MKDTKDRNFLERKYSVDEAAVILGIHPVSVRRIIAEGAMGAYRFRDRVLVGESHLAEYVRRCERDPRRGIEISADAARPTMKEGAANECDEG